MKNFAMQKQMEYVMISNCEQIITYNEVVVACLQMNFLSGLGIRTTDASKDVRKLHCDFKYVPKKYNHRTYLVLSMTCNFGYRENDASYIEDVPRSHAV